MYILGVYPKNGFSPKISARVILTVWISKKKKEKGRKYAGESVSNVELKPVSGVEQSDLCPLSTHL